MMRMTTSAVTTSARRKRQKTIAAPPSTSSETCGKWCFGCTRANTLEVVAVERGRVRHARVAEQQREDGGERGPEHQDRDDGAPPADPRCAAMKSEAMKLDFSTSCHGIAPRIEMFIVR